jgi:hypothetical protein
MALAHNSSWSKFFEDQQRQQPTKRRAASAGPRKGPSSSPGDRRSSPTRTLWSPDTAPAHSPSTPSPSPSPLRKSATGKSFGTATTGPNYFVGSPIQPHSARPRSVYRGPPVRTARRGKDALTSCAARPHSDALKRKHTSGTQYLSSFNTVTPAEAGCWLCSVAIPPVSGAP